VSAIGEFLKARRALVRPEDVGIARYGRRRVPGLRRGELAELAGVSSHYLVRLEQGRDTHPSEQVLDALARALRLDGDATAHLHALARPRETAPAPERVAPGMQQLLDAWTGTPAYVRGRHLDVLASNALARALAPMYRPGENLLRHILLEDYARALFPDWEAIAVQAVAALRSSAGADDPELARELASASEDFRRLWARHDARVTRSDVKRLDHPLVGRLHLRRQALEVSGGDGQVVLAYQAEAGSPSADALAYLASMICTPNTTPAANSTKKTIASAA
jgi:transcriptional regulator with XRE-family HTH domain